VAEFSSFFLNSATHKIFVGCLPGGKETTANKGHHSPEAMRKRGHQFFGRKNRVTPSVVAQVTPTLVTPLVQSQVIKTSQLSAFYNSSVTTQLPFP